MNYKINNKDLCALVCFSLLLMTDSKRFIPYFYNHIKILYNKFEFLEN